MSVRDEWLEYLLWQRQERLSDTHTHTHTHGCEREKLKKGTNTVEVEEIFQVYVNTIMEVP